MAIKKLTCMVCIAGLFISFHLLAEESIQIEAAWVQLGPPVVKTFSAYLKIRNRGDTKQTLKAIRSSAFKAVEIHKSDIQGGMPRMRRMKYVVIEPNSQLVFKSGSYHLMLIEPVKPLKEKQKLDFTLVFESQEIKLAMPVRRR